MVPTSLKAIMAAALISGRDGWGAFAQFFADTVRNISQFARNLAPLYGFLLIPGGASVLNTGLGLTSGANRAGGSLLLLHGSLATVKEKLHAPRFRVQDSRRATEEELYPCVFVTF